MRTGRDVVRELDRLEDDARFWARWTDRLHPDEARAIANGDIGVIKRPIEPEWPVGEWLKVASNLWIKPAKARYYPRPRSWRITFDMRDFRVHLVKRVPQMFEPPELDDFGVPIEHDPEAVERARLDGSYTAAAELAVPEDDESIDDFTARRLSEESRRRWQDEKMMATGNLLGAMSDLRSAIEEMPDDRKRRMSRTLWTLRSRLDSAERELRRRNAA